MFRCTECGAFNRIRADHPAGEAVCGRCKAKLDVSGAPQDVTAEAFSRAVASSPIPVVADFWAPWCGPCRAAAPIVDQFARARAGKVLVLKVNSDKAPDLMRQFGVQGIPAFFAFDGGHEVSRQAGMLPAAAFARWADQVLHKAAA